MLRLRPSHTHTACAFGNAGEGASEVFVVLQRHSTIEGQHGGWSIPARVVQRLGVLGAFGLFRIDDVLQTQRPR